MSRFKRVRRVGLWGLALLGVALLVALADARAAFGASAEGARRVRMERSPQWQEGGFVNPQPLANDWWGVFTGMLETSPVASPERPLDVPHIPTSRFQQPPATGVRVTWFGHSSMLVEIDGHRVLTDPMWSERAGPVTWAGPRRWFAPPLSLAELPPLDAVVISHDHYDHLDSRTIIAMRDFPTTFVVPLGVGAHLESWGVPSARIVELDWWERTRVRGLEIVCTPARHASGRTLTDKDRTLWAGYALKGPEHRVYYSGDTGLFPAMREIGERLGPFDLTMIEVGQYHSAWPDWHIGPEQAVIAHRMLRGKALLPVHWARFKLAYHGWTEPGERVLAAARTAGIKLLTPRPGESVEPELAPAGGRWWPADVAWQSAAVAPIVSTQVAREPLAPP